MQNLKEPDALLDLCVVLVALVQVFVQSEVIEII
jgi:hypothetical protein